MTVSQNNCSICLDPFVDEAKINGCSHTFCYECIYIWSKTANKCTLCSAPFKRIELVSSGNRLKRRTRSGGPPEITRVKPVKQQATWDDDELQRLVFAAEDEREANFFADDNGGDEEDDSQDEYELNDGLVVADDAPIEEADPSTDDEEEEEDESESSSGSVEIVEPSIKRRK